MKRAKFMLAAIAVLAIAGGVYASKARSEKSLFIKTTSTLCDYETFGIATTTLRVNQPTVGIYSATLVAGTCALKSIYTAS